VPVPRAAIEPGAAVGFVGLGHMGLPMSSRLVTAGYGVLGYDSAPEARAAYEAECGTGAAATLADLATARPQVVLLSLPSSPIVSRVLLDEGLLDLVPPDSLIVDMGSSQPTRTRELAGAAAKRGVQLIDAPVSGGVRGARAGTLTVMAGGPDADVEACRPLLETIGGTVLHVGPVGAGHALKALNNLLSATTLLATYEALLVGMRFGLDPKLMLDAINVSTGRSYSTEYKIPEFVLPRTFSAGFALGLMVKDVRTAVDLAEATGTPLALGEVTAQVWEEAAAALDQDADHTEIARWLDSRVEDGSTGLDPG
jgi:3-hydroxyisobutyrate dehydrogenase